MIYDHHVQLSTFTGGAEEKWHIDLKSGSGAVGSGDLPNADVVFTLKDEDFIKMFSGRFCAKKIFFWNIKMYYLYSLLHNFRLT